MKSSRKIKNIDKITYNKDLLISDDIETTESYAGVGEHNLVANVKNIDDLSLTNYMKTKTCKSHSKHSRSSISKPNEILTPVIDFNHEDLENTSKKCINISKSIKKKKLNSGRKISAVNDLERLPPLTSKRMPIERVYTLESRPVSSINDQIEKIESRNVKLSLSEKKNRMKQLLNIGRQNWSQFKSEIDFIKSVESDRGCIVHVSESMIKDEKMLNILLNEIGVDEKENVNNLPDFCISDQKRLTDKEKNCIEIEDKAQMPEDITFKTIIKPTVKEYPSNKLSGDSAMNLKQLLFDSTCRSWGSEWYRQNIEFCPVDSEAPFAMIQKHDGPDNIMAVVQAEFVVEALFHNSANSNWISNVRRNRNRLLANSLSNIITRCKKSESDPFNICLIDTALKGRNIGCVKPDGITECLLIFNIWKPEELGEFLLHHINQFTGSNNPGLVLLVISCLFTYGLSNCLNQLDPTTNRLISPHGIASGELMSLLIHGTVSCHYFNDKLEIIDPQSGHRTSVNGIKSRSSVGFLTIEKHCEYCPEIGTYLKTPKYPVWVVKWKDNRFCVLYCHNRFLISDWKAELKFKLHIYSPSFKTHTVISMNIDSSQTQIKNQKIEEEKFQLQLAAGKKIREKTEKHLQKMSESTLKFLSEDDYLQDLMYDGNDKKNSDHESNYLDQIIYIKWPNATIYLDDNLLDVSNLFRH